MEVREKARRLGQLRYLKNEVDLLSQRIGELELAAQGGSGRITGMPGGPRRSDRTGEIAVKLAVLWERLEARRTRCLELLGALYAFIDDIDDSLLRQIMTYRYIDGETWQGVAERIGEKDEQYPRRLHNRYLAGKNVPSLAKFDENDGKNVV